MTTGYIACQPLEFVDFSGGLTDNFLQGDPRRYARADNFQITVDKKLEERFGTVVYDPTAFLLGSSTSRIAGLFTGISESILFGHGNRDIYTQTPDSSYGNPFTRILGPTGNEAVSGGSIYNQLTTGEFQRQVYFTSDYGVAPGKVFRDQNNAWKAVTAGLPKMAWVPNYPTNASLITACITLANAIRTSMVSHFNDSANIVSGSNAINQHKIVDKWSLSYFVAQTWVNGTDTEFPGPLPTPTPQPNATDETSLYALCNALALAYEHHRNDLAGATPDSGSGARIYHMDIFYDPTGTSDPYSVGSSASIPINIGLAAKLALSGVVASPAKAAAMLDELAQKWYWHQLLPLAHSPSNTYSQMSKYLISVAKIGTIYTSTQTVQVNPNYNDFIAFSYWLKVMMNKHANGTGAATNNMHAQIDPYGNIPIPDPTDFDSAALCIFWARYLYGQIHVFDANAGAHTRIQFTSTTGSNALSAVVTTATGVALTLPVDSWVITTSDYFNDSFTNNRRAARVMSSGSGTAVLSRTVILGGSTQNAQYSISWLHGGYTSGAFVDTTTQKAGTAEFLQKVGSIGTDLNTWLQLGTEFLLCLGAHEANNASHKQLNFLGNDAQGVAPINSNPFFVPTLATYAWAAFYRYQYTVETNGLLYLNQGSPVFSNSIQTTPSYPVGTAIASFNTTYLNAATILVENKCATLTGIPNLINTSLTNYDTTVSVVPQTTDSGQVSFYQNLSLELYRTTNGGTTFFFLDQLANLTSSVSQNYNDAINELFPRPGATALNLQKAMYTSGGVLANDQPPISKYVHTLGGFTYYGAITDTGQFFPQRIRQSIQGAPDSAPATFFDDLEDELVGLSSSRNNLIGVCKNSVYRVSGSFTSTGQGSMSHERISDAIGGLNAKSIVRTEIGVFFAGSDGFYYTDGYQLIKISIDLDKTYRSCTTSDTQRARIYGAYDKITRRIWWSLQSQETAQDNDVFFIYYLDYGVKPSGVFTKALTTASWQPSSAVFYKGNLIIGDSRGYLFKTDSHAKTDPKINTLTAPSTWGTVYIPWDFRTCALDFGTTYMRKWITRIHSVGQNVGNGAIQINSINDNNATGNGIKPLPPIQYLGNVVWGDPRVIWGTASYSWKYDGKMDVWRRFPAGSLRSDFKQIQYAPGNFVVYRSDDYPNFCFATVSKGALTATIQTPSGFTAILWPLDVVDYFISFSTDNYVTKYLVTALDATKKIITFTDPSNTVSNDTTAKWQISGIKKEQRIRITAFDVHFATLGDKNEAYPGSSSPGGQGANA